MERVARNEKLDPLPCPDVRAHNDAFGAAVRVQQEQLERVPEIVLVELVVADAMTAERLRLQPQRQPRAMACARLFSSTSLIPSGPYSARVLNRVQRATQRQCGRGRRLPPGESCGAVPRQARCRLLRHAAEPVVLDRAARGHE